MKTTKITTLHIPQNILLKTAGVVSVAMLMLGSQKMYAQNYGRDEYVSADSLVTPRGVLPDSATVFYPSPLINIAGEEINASIIVDLNKNILYSYDTEGNPECAYLVASGKKSMPTHACIKRVTHIETFPYKSAPESTRRRKFPLDYGPKIICLEIINPESGKAVGDNGEFIHGNHDASSIGKYASKGCIRMDNEAIKELASRVKRGDYVVFSR